MKTKYFSLLSVFLVTLFFSCASATQTAQIEEQPEQKERPAPEKALDTSNIEGYSLRSPFFKADSSAFENQNQAASWLDATASELKKMLEKMPNLRFEVRGYVAVFPNEIDDMALSRARAQAIAKGLSARGIPSSKITAIPAGSTKRFSDSDRRQNRVATVSATASE